MTATPAVCLREELQGPAGAGIRRAVANERVGLRLRRPVS